jgi:RNA polymerase sigma-70 factor, ECF subfamily
MTTPAAPESPKRAAGLDGGRRFQLLSGRSEEGAMPHAGALEAALAEDLEGSFERLVREYQDRLYSFAHRLAGNSEDAEEIAQDAFVRAYRAMKTYEAQRIRALSLKAWLYQITLNVARNRLRGKRRKFVSIDARDADGRALWEPEDDPGSRPDARFEEGRRRADIGTLVAGLPERYRSALILRYMEGLRLEEVAAVLKQPLGTVKSNVHRAVNALREALSDSRRGGAMARQEVRS